MYEFKLPDLGEGIHECEIVLWHVDEGGQIEEDSPLVDVESDKAMVTIPSPKGGKIVKLTCHEGDIVLVGSVIAVIDDGSTHKIETPTADTIESESDEPVAATVTKPADSDNRPVPAAPATRRLARELGVNLRLVAASGPGGRVTPDDVRNFADSPVSIEQKLVESVMEDADASKKEELAIAEFGAHASTAIPLLDIDALPDFEQFGPVEKVKLRSIRRKVAHRMVTSMILIPHVSHMDEADVTKLEKFRIEQRKRLKDKPGGHLTLLPFVIKAVIAGLKKTKALNASLDPFNEEIIYKKYYNIGIAVDTPAGLIVPVIKDANTKSILELSAEIEDKASRARDGKIEVNELKGGTFTITNIGPIGGTALLPTINYPEVAILAMGRAQEKPVVRNGEIVIRKMLPLTMSFDHRIADGADAARFVSEMTRELSDPNLLLLET